MNGTRLGPGKSKKGSVVDEGGLFGSLGGGPGGKGSGLLGIDASGPAALFLGQGSTSTTGGVKKRDR